MNEVLKTVLSLSLSGSLAGAALLLGRPLYRGRLSCRWRYYIWLVVLARLLLPLAPEASPVGELFQRMERESVKITDGSAAFTPPSGEEKVIDAGISQEMDPKPEPAREKWAEWGALVLENLWLVWLGGALLLLVRRITGYQSFVRYTRAGQREVSDIARLDRLARIGEEAGVKRPVELYVNGLVSSPLLLGFFRPRIVLPSEDIPDEDFRYTVLHELSHFRRGDMFYKWLVQAAVCVHWFNPLVWLMAREINRACELACDEAVLERLDPRERRAYGDTLLRAMEAGGGWKSSAASVTLNEGGKLLKERLAAIIKYGRYSKMTQILSLALAALLAVGAAMAGAYTGPEKREAPPAEAGKPASQTEPASLAELDSQLERYYESGSLPLFQITASGLDSEGRNAWAGRLYGDGSIAFFSLLADDMGEEELEAWLDRALEDGQFAFQAMLFGKLDREEEKDAMEEKWAARQMAEYERYGVTWDGEDFYYQGQLVNIFLDARKNGAFMTLDVNPKGTVHVKIVRDANDQILRAENMAEEEAAALLEDMYGPDEDSDDERDGWDRDGGAVSLTEGDLPEAVREALRGRDNRAWYVVGYGDWQYISCKGFGWSFGYQPVWTDGGWRVEIVKFQRKDSGDVLLSLPAGEGLEIAVDGEAVSYTRLEA